MAKRDITQLVAISVVMTNTLKTELYPKVAFLKQEQKAHSKRGIQRKGDFPLLSTNTPNRRPCPKVSAIWHIESEIYTKMGIKRDS